MLHSRETDCESQSAGTKNVGVYFLYGKLVIAYGSA